MSVCLQPKRKQKQPFKDIHGDYNIIVSTLHRRGKSLGVYYSVFDGNWLRNVQILHDRYSTSVHEILDGAMRIIK